MTIEQLKEAMKFVSKTIRTKEFIFLAPERIKVVEFYAA